MRATAFLLLMGVGDVGVCKAFADELQAKPLEEHPGQSAWAGSELAYRNAFGVLDLYQGGYPTWNPKYLQSLLAHPKWSLKEDVVLSAQIELLAELTQSDWTTDRFHFSDLSLSLANSRMQFAEFFGTRVEGKIGVRLPTSKVSRAQGLIFAPSLNVVLSRGVFAVKGLQLAADLGVVRPVHRYTTGELDEMPIHNCETPGCLTLRQIPIRNVELGLSQMFLAQWQLTSKFGVSAFFGLSQNRLYGLDTSTRSSYRVESPVQWRYGISSGLACAHRLGKGFSINYGLASTHAPFMDNGRTRYLPLFNRHALFFLDVKASLPELFASKTAG
jgi:hypothetical protein